MLDDALEASRLHPEQGFDRVEWAQPIILRTGQRQQTKRRAIKANKDYIESLKLEEILNKNTKKTGSERNTIHFWVVKCSFLGG